MTEGHTVLEALAPVILLLCLGVVAAVGSRALRLSPIVGYLGLGVGLQLSGLGGLAGAGSVSLLAELGVVFLLFDIGLHFSLAHVREQARDIFGFGPVQVLTGTLGLGLVGWALGLSLPVALFTGAVLALSSTAVVARLIAERHQQNCPVGLTATAILIFQDVAAIFLLIVAQALAGSGGIAVVAGLALLKAAAAFGVAVLLSRVVVRPLFDLIARGRNEEVFTAMALLVALAAGWATGQMGLSLTLGAFLGGMIVAETPYRAIIQAEIKPFRGLLLGFFFISVGLSLDTGILLQQWPAVLGVTAGLIAVKVLTNAGASLIFRWSVPGSTQLGFLLAQGSEFAFVVLTVPAVHAMIGDATTSVLMASVALTLAVTPNLAELGRSLAGRMRAGIKRKAELQMQDVTGPVLIVGMGTAGRTLADALEEFGIGYAAIERDPRRLAEATADGYRVNFGDMADPRLWEPVAVSGRQLVAITAPSYEASSDLTPIARTFYPNVQRVVLLPDEAELERFAAIGLRGVLDRNTPRGIDLAEAILLELGVEPDAITSWTRRQRERASPEPGDALVAA